MKASTLRILAAFIATEFGTVIDVAGPWQLFDIVTERGGTQEDQPTGMVDWMGRLAELEHEGKGWWPNDAEAAH